MNSMIPSPGEPNRFNSAKSANEYVGLLVRADTKRSQQRALTKGLIDGNPPYDSQMLFDEGRGGECNVNFREAENYVQKAIAAFYDLYAEAPTYTTITATSGDGNKRVEWSNRMTIRYNDLEKSDKSRDFRTQISQYQMTVFGCGPLFWRSPLDWRPTAIKCANLLVPDQASSDITTWECCAVKEELTVSELYEFIENEAAAKAVGWRISAVTKSISIAVPKNSRTGASESWEDIQSCLRNNDLLTGAKSKTAKCAHVLYREKDGTISHVIVDEANDDEFLYYKKGEYQNWKQALCCMYYDRGDGTHHSVKGLGIKMYGPIEIKNRLKCMTVNGGVMRTQVWIQPKDAAAAQNMQIIPMGTLSIFPPNSEVIQQSAGGVLDAPMAVDQALDYTISANLSQYQGRIEKPNGNPRTATEIDAIMAQQSTLGKTQLSRYYEQLDDVAAECYRRVVNNVYTREQKKENWDMAMDYVENCLKDGIPIDVIKKAKATATRVVGQGNPYLRIQTLTDMLAAVSLFPEGGRKNLIDDWIAAKVGQNMVQRYNPSEVNGYEQDQVAWAVMENGMFKDGMMPLVTGSQNHLIHARQHITDGSQAVNSIQENPNAITDVAAYLQVLIPHTMQHLQAMQSDATRKSVMPALIAQFNQLASVANDLIQHATSAPAGGSAQPEQGGDNEEQMKMLAFQADQQRKDKALEADIHRKDTKLQHTLAISDAKTAHALASKPMA